MEETSSARDSVIADYRSQLRTDEERRRFDAALGKYAFDYAPGPLPELPTVSDEVDRAATELAVALTVAEVCELDTAERSWQHAVADRMLRAARGGGVDGLG